MSKLFWTLCLGGFVCLIGCNEFIGPVERTSAAPAVIDVVGDSGDSITNVSNAADIQGDSASFSESTAAVVESTPAPNTDSPIDGSQNTLQSGVPETSGRETTDSAKTSSRNLQKVQ